MERAGKRFQDAVYIAVAEVNDFVNRKHNVIGNLLDKIDTGMADKQLHENKTRCLWPTERNPSIAGSRRLKPRVRVKACLHKSVLFMVEKVVAMT